MLSPEHGDGHAGARVHYSDQRRKGGSHAKIHAYCGSWNVAFVKVIEGDLALALNWKSLGLICGRPVHHGFSANDKTDLVATPAGNPADVVRRRATFQREQVHD